MCYLNRVNKYAYDIRKWTETHVYSVYLYKMRYYENFIDIFEQKMKSHTWLTWYIYER
jgi:hypothetical protein